MIFMKVLRFPIEIHFLAIKQKENLWKRKLCVKSIADVFVWVETEKFMFSEMFSLKRPSANANNSFIFNQKHFFIQHFLQFFIFPFAGGSADRFSDWMERLAAEWIKWNF